MEIFVGNLPLTLRRWHLQEIFEKYGEVSSATVVIDYDTKQSKGYGFVKMPDRQQALDAISSLNGREIDGVPLVVNETKFQRDEGRERKGRTQKTVTSPKSNPAQDRYASTAARKLSDTRKSSGNKSGSSQPDFAKKKPFKKK